MPVGFLPKFPISLHLHSFVCLFSFGNGGKISHLSLRSSPSTSILEPIYTCPFLSLLVVSPLPHGPQISWSTGSHLCSSTSYIKRKINPSITLSLPFMPLFTAISLLCFTANLLKSIVCVPSPRAFHTTDPSILKKKKKEKKTTPLLASDPTFLRLFFFSNFLSPTSSCFFVAPPQLPNL